MDMKDLFHIDPLTAILVLVGFVGMWYTLRNDSKWHTEWIKKHDMECDEQRITTNRLITEIQSTNSRLVTLAEAHGDRLNRVEHYIDNVRI